MLIMIMKMPSWSVFGQAIRTKGNVEGWFTRLNQRAKKGSIPLCLLVDLLTRDTCARPKTKGNCYVINKKHNNEADRALFHPLLQPTKVDYKHIERDSELHVCL